MRFAPTQQRIVRRPDEPTIQGSGVLAHILQEEDEQAFLSLGMHVSHNYYINKIYVNDTKALTYVLSNLLPAKTEESSTTASEDQVLSVIQNHLSRLNAGLLALHRRVEERLARMEALEEKANA